MLLIDNKQVSVDQFIAEVERISGKKVPREEIKHNMEFTYNQVKNSYDLGTYRDTGRKVPKQSRGEDVLASFRVYYDGDKDARTVEFRFANRTPFTNPQNPNVLIHDPKAIEFPSGVFSFEPREEEKVIYLYCHPACADSPFFKKDSVHKYSHNNLKASSKKKAQELELKKQAWNHAMNVPNHELKILAKGLNLNFHAQADETDLKVLLQEFAMENPQKYMEKVEKETTMYDGMVQEALDMGVIKATNIAGSIMYSFAQGQLAGQAILNVDPKEKNPVEALKIYMKSNIQKYYPYLATLSKNISADMSAEKYLRSIKNGAETQEILPYKEETTLLSVVDYNSAKDYLTEIHPDKKQPAPANVKKFLDLVLDGEINDGNVAEESLKYISKKAEA